MVRNERILCVIVDITSYFTPVLISFRYFFPLLFSSALPCRLDFPMQRYSGRPASSTTVLTALEFARQPSANQRWPFSSPTCRACRVGYSVKFPAVCLPFRPFPAVWLACKISPGKESRKASEEREKKNDV